MLERLMEETLNMELQEMPGHEQQWEVEFHLGIWEDRGWKKGRREW